MVFLTDFRKWYSMNKMISYKMEYNYSSDCLILPIFYAYFTLEKYDGDK